MFIINTQLEKLIVVLSELRTASMQSNSSNIKSIMNKYDMLFLGGKFNTIYSVELCHSLSVHFDIKINNEALNKLIPIACNTLNMKFEPLIKLSKLGSSDPSCFSITLW